MREEAKHCSVIYFSEPVHTKAIPYIGIPVVSFFLQLLTVCCVVGKNIRI